MKLFVKTFGCQMNAHDTARIGEIMQRAGYALTDDPRDADVALINSCTVREKAWHKGISEAGRLRLLKRPARDVVVGIVGCVAEQEGARIFSLIPGVDLVVAPDHYAALPALVEEVRRERSPRAVTGFDTGGSGAFLGADTALGNGSHSAFVTVMKGCDERCAYCIVPTVRGPERCRSADDIVGEVRALAGSGVREVTLLGQKVNAYQHGSTGFVALLERLDATPGIERLRFVSPHPRHMEAALTSLFGRLATLCESIHLPLQAGSNAVLDRMHRRYRAEEYLDVVERLRTSCPEIAVTTDIIVGFPGETDAEFEQTLRIIDRARFNGAFSFKYSPRPGTPAASLADDVPLEEKNRRLAAVHERIGRLEREWRTSLLGKELEVLVAHDGRLDGQIGGRARNGQIVNFPAPGGKGLDQFLGELVDVAVTEVHPHSLEGVAV
jgi:tRNA-2-methylthio-N6-dimethylallyladenosine synthase